MSLSEIPGASSSKSGQQSDSSSKSPDTTRRSLLLSPDAARARHLSSTSSTSATSGESASRGERGGSGGGTHLIKHRKFLGGGGGASSKSGDKSRDNQPAVVLVGYKHKATADGRREVAVGTLVDSHGAGISSGVVGTQSTSTSGISSSSNDLDASEEARETPEEIANGRPPIHSSGSMPYLTHLNNAVGAVNDSSRYNAVDATYILQQQRLQQQPHHLLLEDASSIAHVVDDPATSTTNLMMQSSMSGSLPDLASQEVVIDFPPQMTKSQQLMDQFQADSANDILEAVDAAGREDGRPVEEMVSVYDILVETMQVDSLS